MENFFHPSIWMGVGFASIVVPVILIESNIWFEPKGKQKVYLSIVPCFSLLMAIISMFL